MLSELDTWLRQHRAGYYKSLNGPAAQSELKQIEDIAEHALPVGLRTMLEWRGGQPKSNVATFNPIGNEMFMSPAAIIDTMREMIDEARGDSPASAWQRHWVPFMDNGNSDLSAVDSKSGRIISFEHEGPHIAVTHRSFEHWLRKLLAELRTCNFSNWDITEDRGT